MANGNGWESNPPRLATRPDTGVEDREAHQDLAIPVIKNNFLGGDCQLDDDEIFRGIYRFDRDFKVYLDF